MTSPKTITFFFEKLKTQHLQTIKLIPSETHLPTDFPFPPPLLICFNNYSFVLILNLIFL